MLKFLLHLVLLYVFIIQILGRRDDDDEEYDPFTTTDPSKREPSPCEVCKFFATELTNRLAESGKSKEVIETGHGLERKKKFKYLTSELRLTEALNDPHICEKILDYNVHAERTGSLRYSKGMSETFQTLHGLVDKGVKVELGMPYELWDKPSAEVSKMHRACFNLAEQYEDVIETWYYHKQDQHLLDYLCSQRYLSKVKWDKSCLAEEWTGSEKRPELMPGYKGDSEENDQEEKRKQEMEDLKREKAKSKTGKKNKKGDKGKKDEL